MRKTVLVTGGAGFIGSNFLYFLHQHYPEYRLLVVDALTYAGSVENLPKAMQQGNDPNSVFWYGDVCNADLVNSMVAEADFIVHFAAETHVTRSIYDNWRFFQTDILGTQNIANALLKHRNRVERFIHISTSEVYGTALTASMDEDHPLNPMSPYASAKCGADRLIYSYWATYRLPVVTLRPFNNFGPRQHLEKVVPRFITSVLLNQPLTIHGDGSAMRDFVFVEDVCRAIAAVMHAPEEKVLGKVYNVATGIHRSVSEIALDIVTAMNGNPDLMKYYGDRPGQVFRHTGNSARIRNDVGWMPTMDWKEGLSRTIDWYRQNQPQWSRQIWLRHVPIMTADNKIEYH